MILTQHCLRAILEHAAREYYQECCGLIAYDEHGVGVQAHEAINVAPFEWSYSLFEIDPLEMLRVNADFESRGLRLGSVYHSHLSIDPYPSVVDVHYGRQWPDIEWLIISLKARLPELANWRLPFIEREILEIHDG